jgi:membrane associated rhomboid family serine protease
MSATSIILLLTILLSILGLLSPRFMSGAVLRPYLIARGSDYDALITSGFVHADLAHLFFNLITLYSFGPSLEREIGMTQFILLYLCGLLVSAIGTCIKHRDEPNYASLGASGAILAVLFASIVYFPHQQIFIFPLPVPIPAPLFAVGYLAFSFYSARRAASYRDTPETLPGPGPTASAPDSVLPAVPGTATPEALPPVAPPAPGPIRSRSRINHDAHIFGALTGLVFVLITSPERFQALLHYLDR